MSITLRRLSGLAVWVAMWLPLFAHAHKASDAYLQLQVDGSHVEQRFDIALRDLDRDLALDANDDGQLDWGEVRSRWIDIDRLAQQAVTLQANGRACEAGPSGTLQLDEHSDGRYAVITRRWNCAEDVRELNVGYTLFAATDPLHRGVVRVQQGGHAEPAVLVPGASPRIFAISSTEGDAPASGFFGFVAEGVHHILIGTDHILFLLSLLLPAVLVRSKAPGERTTWSAAPSLRPVLGDVLRVVTAFTVAHSITLALAAFDIVNPPSRWIESAIAASVVLAALNNIYPVIREGRWKLTFLFGLVHGFGFASALKDAGLTKGALALPLFGFNLGVELGQLAVVALFMLAVWQLRRTQFYRRGVLVGGSLLISVVALAWLTERAFDMQLPWPV
jgi:hypothetical protein